MPLRNLSEVPYIPMLALRPAEMQALEELPDQDKTSLMPFFQLCPWTTAHQLSSSLSRLEEAYGDRPSFILPADPDPSPPTRQVHFQLASLRNPDGGYAAWCEFIEGKANFVPAVQLGSPPNIALQVSRLHGLGRGLLIPFERPVFSSTDFFARQIAPLTNLGRDVCFLLDFGKANRDLIGLQFQAIGLAESILRHLPNAYVALSASSFPDSFTSITSQDIFERMFFDGVAARMGGRLIYSDRGSARAERQLGGGGSPAPRIDYPLHQAWLFFRSDEAGHEAYFHQARLAMLAPEWDPNLRVWGTQMIERTALGDRSAIVSPKRATAARINIHMHRQLFGRDDPELYNTDDEWVD